MACFACERGDGRLSLHHFDPGGCEGKMSTTKQEPKHQIIRQAMPTGDVMWHIISCVCGARIATTTSLKIADRKAEYHLEVYR